MTIQLTDIRPEPAGEASGWRELRVTAGDARTARQVARIVEDVRGRAAELVGDGLTVRVRGVDGRAAVDLLAELSWAGAVPESFALL